VFSTLARSMPTKEGWCTTLPSRYLTFWVEKQTSPTTKVVEPSDKESADNRRELPTTSRCLRESQHGREMLKVAMEALITALLETSTAKRVRNGGDRNSVAARWRRSSLSVLVLGIWVGKQFIRIWIDLRC